MSTAIRSASISLLTLLVLLFSVAAFGQVPVREFAPVQKGSVTYGEQVEIYRPGRVLVQFTRNASSKLQIRQDTLNKGAGGILTGLESFDAAAAPFALQKMDRTIARTPNNRRLAENLGVERWYSLDFGAASDMEAVAARLRLDPNVENATPDYRAFPAAIPNDPLHPDHWGHNNTAQLPDLDWGGTYDHTLPNTVGTPGFDSNAQAAWDGSQAYGSASVVIAILDSGVDIDHPDLRLVAGWDYGDNDSNPDDNSAQAGHGTACAGVAAAIANNGLGTAGIAGGCSIMPLKVANSAGSMFFSSIQNALYHAADNGAEFASMSLGAAISSDPATDAALQYAYNAGVTLLAATGNENASTISYPAINQYVIAVGAASPCGERKRSSSSSAEVNPGVNTDPNGYTCDGERWWGSNYGSNVQGAASAVDIIAPTILPTTDIGGSAGYAPGDYEDFFNGTSCSTPYAAGVAALVKTLNPTWTPAQIRTQLRDTAIDITSVESGAGWDRYTGYGMVDAEAAVGGGGPPTDPPVAAFSGTPTSGNIPLTVNFTDSSSNSPTSWSWTFGDGGSSSAQNPSYTYTAAGTYTVTLTATNAFGSDSETKTNYITVVDPADTYTSLPYTTGFEGGSLDQYWTTSVGVEGRIQVSTANGPHSGSYHLLMDDTINGGSYSLNEAWLQLNLAGESQVDLDFWWKEFGDETHTQDGVYFSDNGGSSFTKVLDLPGSSYTNNTWQNFTLDLDALAAGAGLSLSSTFVVKFQQYDNYSITTDGFAFDDISVTAGATGSPPTAAFSGTPTSGTTPLTVNFTDESTDGPTSWSWTFGDGGTSSAQNPSHTYTVAGTYNVSLTVTNAFGSDSLTRNAYITVTDPGGGGVWETITYDDFESGWGSYTDGGRDCSRYTGGTYAWQGFAAANIQDNSGVSSSFYHTTTYNVSAYVDLEVEFYFYARSMETNEDFWVQYYNGSTWQTIAAFARGVHFNNNTFYNVVLQIPAASYNYPTNARLRFMCDASGNADDVYIDQIEFRGLTAGGAGGELALDKPALPTVFGLSQNYPNPFNPSTTIQFAVPHPSRVRIDIYDVRGRRVTSLVDDQYEAGHHSVIWNAQGVASGNYFYRMRAGSYVETKGMLLVK